MSASSSVDVVCSSSLQFKLPVVPTCSSSSSPRVRKQINPLSLSILPSQANLLSYKNSLSTSSSSEDNQPSTDSSEGNTSKAVSSVLNLAQKIFVETRPYLLQKSILKDQRTQDYIRTHFIPIKSLSKKPKKVIHLLKSVNDYIVGQAVYISEDNIISNITKNEHLCILKSSYPSIRKTAAEFLNQLSTADSEQQGKRRSRRNLMKSEDKSTETFRKNFNQYDKLREEYIEKAIDALIRIKEGCWEYKNGVKVSPIPDAVPLARKAFFEMYFCDDENIKEMALNYLIELLECDPLTKRTADELINLQENLLAEINENKVQNRTISIQRLLIKAYSICLECILLHSGQRHLNGVIDEFKHEIWDGAGKLSDLNVANDEEIKFWTAYAIQGAQRIQTNVSLLLDMFNRLFKVVKAGLRIASAINSPQEGGAALEDAYNLIMEAIWHIRWLKDWFDLVLMAKKLCRYTMHDVQAFRQVIDFVQQIKREESGNKLFYGIVSGLEYVISKTIHPEIREEGLKLLLQYMTVDNVEIKERVILAFTHLVEFNEQGGKLQNTAYIILKLLESTEEEVRPQIQSLLSSFPPNITRGLEHQQMIFEKTEGDLNNYLFVNAIKFLLRRIAEIKDEEDFGGHSFVTLLSSSNEDRITPALLSALKSISPHFLKPDVYGNTPYHVSVRKRNPRMIEYIYQSMPEIPINDQDFQNRDTALHLAVSIGDDNIVKQLLKLDANPNVQNANGDTPLHLAIENNRAVIARLLLDSDTHANIVNNNGETPLNIAVRTDQVKLVDLLIKAGGYVSEHVNQCTHIIIAAQQNSEKTLIYLIEKMHFSLKKLESLEILKMISRDRRTLSCSMDFANYHYQMMTENETYRESFKPFCVWPKLAVNDQNEVFLNVENQITRCQAFGNTVLMQLVTGNSSKNEIREHMRYNPNEVNQANYLLVSPLHGAVASHNYEAVNLLIKAGANVNVADARGFTPLHLAVYVNDAILVEKLLKAQADPNVVNDFGDTPFLLHAGVMPNRIPSSIDTVLSKVERLEPGANDIPGILMRYGADPNACDVLGNYAVHHALLYGNADTLYSIMNSHSDLMWKSDKIWIGGKIITPLEEAAMANKKEAIKALFDMLSDEDLCLLEEELFINDNISITMGNILAMIDDGENFERLVLKKPVVAYRSDKSLEKLTPIHIAGKRNSINILRVYINLGLKLDTMDGFNNNLAHHAARKGNREIIEELTRIKKFDFSATNFDARTPLHMAAINDQFTIFQMIFALDPKLAIEKDGSGETALHLACRRNHFDIVVTLVDAFPQAIESVNDNGNTPIHLAAAMDPTCRTLHYLLNKMNQYANHTKKSIHVDSRNAYGQTPLLLASQQGHLEAVRLLCTRGSDILAQDDEKESALHKAVFNNHIEVVQELLLQDRNVSEERKLVHQKDIRGEIPLHEIAKKRGNYQERQIKCDIFRLLLEAGSNLKAKCEMGETVLHAIGSYGMLHLLETLRDWLTESKIKINFNIKNNHGDTILHKACYNNHNVIIQLIVDLDVNINGRNNKGQTPLHVAIEQNHIVLAKYLMSLKARLRITDAEGKTVLHYLLQQKRLSNQALNLLKRLLRKKPSLITYADDNKETIFHYIARHNHLEAFDIILASQFREDIPVSKLLWEKNRDGQAAYDIARDQGNVILRREIQSFNDDLLTPNPNPSRIMTCTIA